MGGGGGSKDEGFVEVVVFLFEVGKVFFGGGVGVNF